MSDQSTDDADRYIRDEPEASAAHKVSGEPAGNQSYEQDYEEALTSHGVMPFMFLLSEPSRLWDTERKGVARVR